MDIDIPPWLQWVSYLAGDTWPQGSETGMLRIDEFFDAAATALDDLLPDLNRVRGETLSVLFGETAQAADGQFSMLFDGDYAVDKLSDAVRALGESAGYTGSEIEYSKLSIIVGLALAAAEISYSLAMSGPTAGASTAAIPGIEWATITSFRQLVAAVLRQVRAKVRDMLARTTVKQLIHEGFQEAGEEVAQQAAQEGIIYGVQGDRYHVNTQRLILNGVSSTVGGGAGGVSAVPVSHYLGPAATRLGAARKGATTLFTAGIVGNVAGTASVGGNPFADPLMMLTSSTTSSVGGLRGAGVSPGHADNTSNGQRPNPPPTPGPPPPDGPLPDGPQPDGPDGDPESARREPEAASDNGGNDNGRDQNSVDGARISDSPTDESAAVPHAAHTDDVGHQPDESTTSATQTTDPEASADNDAAQPEPAATHHADPEATNDSSDVSTSTEPNTVADQPDGQPTPGTSDTDATPPVTESGHGPDAHTTTDAEPPLTPDGDPESVVAEPTTDQTATMPTISDTAAPADTPAAADPAGHAPATRAAPAASVVPTATPSAQASPPVTSASAPTDTSTTTPPRTKTPPTEAPKHAAQQRVPESPAAGVSSSDVAGTPAARVSGTTATPADTKGSDTEQAEAPQSETRRLDDDAAIDRVAEVLSSRLGREIRLAPMDSRTGRPARAVFEAAGSAAQFANYSDVAQTLQRLGDGSSAILTSSWVDGSRQGGHPYVAVNDGGQIYLDDPSTGQRSAWPPSWGEDSVSRTAVGYFDSGHQPVGPLQDALSAAAAVGDVQGQPIDGDDGFCAHNAADLLSARYGRDFRVDATPTSTGIPARALFQAVGSDAHFATYADVEQTLRQMGDGSAAVLTSKWADGSQRKGGHAYLAVNDGGQIYLLDTSTRELSGWPPHWGQDAVSRTAVGYLDARGDAVRPLQDPLAAADAVGDVKGQPTDGDGGPAERWRDVTPQRQLAEAALAQRGVHTADALRNPLGLMEAASDRTRNNANWWAGLTGAEQRALIDTFPQHIGNAEGIPASARHEANLRSLEQDRRELQARRDRGERLTRGQRKQLARLDRIDSELSRAGDAAERAGVGGPLLLAFDPMAFGGDGRAMVSFGTDPYKADSVSWHVPGTKMTIDQIGYCMGDALNHLQSTLREDSTVSAASIAWIGYDTPSGFLRAASRKHARAGAAILYSDIRAFNTARDTWAGDGSHFTGNHIFAHSYGSTTASYAGRDGRLAHDVRTVTLIGSPGAGPLRHASEFGIGDNVYVASSSRDPFAALGGRSFGSGSRILGIGLGLDPAMESFGAQRVTAEFPAPMDRRQNLGTHNAYYRFVDRTADPSIRSESLANFGRIAAGHADRVDLEGHRTVDERPGRLFGTRELTVEPAAGRSLRLEGDTAIASDRDTRRPWNPRWRGEPADAEPQQDTDVEPQQHTEPPTKEVADAALKARGIRATDLVTPVDPRITAEQATARARGNAEWWAGLSQTERQSLVQFYPRQVGNAEGIPPLARHDANYRELQRYLTIADGYQSMRDNGIELTNAQLTFIQRLNAIDAALHSAARNAARAGVGGPYLLAFDPPAFKASGRAIVSFGADPYEADSVSWYVPGMTTTIDRLRPMMQRAFNQLQSTLRENPTLKAASITYIGYNAPGSFDPRVAAAKMARAGGQILCNDISSFNAGRDAWTADGSHFSGNHIFAHSYGSTTASFAGEGGRLAQHIRTVTLVGSPGAGPLRHASDFGIGAENVFVAASSRDEVTGLGGGRPGVKGRIIGKVGLGVDPAMDSFGAQRITSEFPADRDHLGRGSRGTHSLYWSYMDHTASPPVRSESLTNFGRIAAGHGDRVDLEGHRSVIQRPGRLYGTAERTVDPAVGRPLRLVDDPGAHHPAGGRHQWNPRWHSGSDCAHLVADELSGRYDREIRVDVTPTRRGVPARALFEAVGSGAHFATYADVADRLRQLGDGSAAVLASRWSGWRQGGHAYLAVNDGGEIYLIDAHTGQRSGWPPHWGQNAVAQTAVGYLDAHGNPVDPLDGGDRKLSAAEVVGHVKGHPDPVALVADAALAQGGMQADDLLNPHGSAQLAADRAQTNAAWWAGLTEAQRQALIETYPHEIGNSEGIPPPARHEANSRVSQSDLERRDNLLALRDNGISLTREQNALLSRIDGIESALRSVGRTADRAGVGGPVLLAYDRMAFGGAGRAIVSFGADPYQAQSVSWYVPGMTTDIDKLRPFMMRALNQQRSTVHENPELSAASICYIGYNAPASFSPKVASTDMARAGGQVLRSDIWAFNAGRDAWTPDGSHFTGNHIFAHSYGSTTATFAGQGGRLAQHIRTVTLIGSPGAGPMQHASDFGIGAENVFVASSSRDGTTALGGDRPGVWGRVAGKGLGLDPAMDSFGARRVTAEFTAELDRTGRGSRFTHSLYWAYMDASVYPPVVRSESLANFGRIAAGKADPVDGQGGVAIERHRTLVEGPGRGPLRTQQTLEPAAGRPLRLIDNLGAHYPTGPRHSWNPRWNNNCAHQVADHLSGRYDREFRVAAALSHKGVPARALFEAVGSGAHFTTYADVADRLHQLGDGSTAVLASRWSGWRQGGHAYLAVNDGGEIYLLDAHTGQRSGWPPHWGQIAVAQTAVGYLDAHGNPVQPLDGDSRRLLGAADVVGHVKGYPDISPDRAAAHEALAQRVPPVRIEELVNPLGSADMAAERSKANLAWWAGLTEAQRQALIHTYPQHIGNTEGIPAAARDSANHIVLQQYRDLADQVRSKLDEFVRPSKEESDFLRRVDQLDNALRKTAADADRVGVDGPLLLALEPGRFGGDGRIVLGFGDDPYAAKDVSFHVANQPIVRLGTAVGPALDQLQSADQATQSAAAIVWVGNAGQDGALHSDLGAFHAVRGAGEPVTSNRVHTLPAAAVDTSRLWVPPDAGSLVVAHRGASHDFPEQTLAAYEEALRQGADGLECDVRLTRDGQLVLIHDKRVDRTSDGTGRVGDMTLAQLREFDFGGWHPSRELGDAQGDTTILTLDQLVQLVLDHDRQVTLFIETKHPDKGGWRLEREVVDLLQRYGLANPASADQARAAVISFYPDALLRVRQSAPTLPTVLLGASARYLGPVVGATGIGPSIATLRANPELVDRAAARGMTTYCWTVNEQNDVRYARDLGVSWIATDHPGQTNAMLGGETTEQSEARETITVTTTEPQPAASVTDVRAVADEALAHRVPPVRPDELRNPLGVPEEAEARARNNANWWSGLSNEQRQALIETYPQHIGNAEGIPGVDRDAANRRVLQRVREFADRVQSKIDAGQRTTAGERKFLKKANRLDEALRKASRDAERAGEEAPLLLAFDPTEFGGDGRAVLSFGADPYDADSVSWHVPGVLTGLHSLFGFYTRCALNHLQSVRHENPTLKATSIAWIGYDAPGGLSGIRDFLGIRHAAGQTAAQAGGDILFSDINAFNAGRNAWSDDDSRFTGNHVFGYSYGSTATAYAGRDGRLGGQVRTVALVGSPGAGPLKQASDFGVGAENVYVASSSRDPVTAFGAQRAGLTTRILSPIARIFGLGLGVDPAMDSFGAVRITAEASASRNRLLSAATHQAYYLNVDTASDVRSESLVNFGRIAGEHPDGPTVEQHRTTEGRRTVDPAAARSARRFFNPPWRSAQDCANRVADELSAMYGRDFHLAVEPSRRGVPARALFAAVGSGAQFATYADVADMLQQLGDGSSAVLASRWSGGRYGGHAYLAVNEGGQIRLYDPHGLRRSGWPPHWGQDAVTRTAVGYLDAHGNAVTPLVHAPLTLQLDAADAVGKVRGPREDSDFVRQQQEYRAQDPTTRHVDTRYAQPFGDVVNNATNPATVDQLAADLSGMYGPYRVEFKGSEVSGDVYLDGKIFSGDREIGRIQRIFSQDGAGNLVAYHTGVEIDDTQLRGKGFAKALTTELERYYVQSGVDRIELRTHDKGGYAWSRRGFTWNTGDRALQESLNSIKASARTLSKRVGEDARAVLDELVQRLDPKNPRLPEPIDIANLASADEPNLGRRLLEGVGLRQDHGVNLVRYLPAAAEATTRPHSGFKGWVQRTFGFGGDPGSGQDCAHLVADELSAMYGRDIRIPAARSPMGVPAWALFEAVGTGADFATYADVADRLRVLGDGSAAVLASRWAAGRQGGHAYLAVNEGGQIHLYDPHTGQRSGWPPHWGQDAVSRTAVGYLDANGNPVAGLTADIPLQLQLSAADTVGDVKGHPDDPDFLLGQVEYRAQDPNNRFADTRYADPLGDVVDNASDRARVDQLAADLSGVYGPYRIQLAGSVRDGRVILDGLILSGNTLIGAGNVRFGRDPAGNLVVSDFGLAVDDNGFRGQGFDEALTSELEQYYVRSGVDRIEVWTVAHIGSACARQGFTWDPDPSRLQESLDSLKESARELAPRVSTEAQALLRDIAQRLHPDHPRLPEPIELAALITPTEPDLGRQLLDATQWHAVKHMQAGVADDHNCALLVADALSARYGRDIRVAAAPTPRGVQARALFEAVGSGSRFTSYTEVADTLRQLGDGSSAVLASRWAGGERRGGHAYLAVNDGGQIYLLDPFTGQRSGWPPHWGQDAVARTAVGYLDADGEAVRPLDDRGLQLVAADAIGHVQGHPDTRAKVVADAALAQRVPPVWADDLRNPLGQMDEAVGRAQANAAWWPRLSDAQRQALIETYPRQIGNAEGIPAADRDNANRLALQRARDFVQSKVDRGERPSRRELDLRERMNRVDATLRDGAAAAERAEVGGPMLLAFDPSEFGNDGRAVISFGDDPYQAESVSWLVPGTGVGIDRLGDTHMPWALTHLQSTRESSTRSAASVVWIGYDAPGRLAIHPGQARTGGDILYSDICAFNATRDALATDGSYFIGNHIVADSFGATTAGHAGRDGRLGNQICTVTLRDPRGVVPQRHARNFGIGAENVFVVESSLRDPAKGLVGRTLGRLGIGLGTNPATESFGAQRVTTAIPAVDLLNVDTAALDGPAQAVADAALTQRVPPVRAEDVVNPLGSTERAAARARANTAWWTRLSDAQRQALIDTYPYRIGNAEGIPATARNAANRRYLQHATARAEQVRSKLNDGQRLTDGERKFLGRVKRIETWLRHSDRAAERAGLGEPLVLAFDPNAFGGDGRLLISFGDDPYRASKVSWHIARRAIDQPGIRIRPVLDQLQSAQRDTESAAAIVWIGNNSLPGTSSGNAFYSDLAAFRAAREAGMETGEAANHVYALRSSSTTVAERSAYGRASANVLWVPPGEGPLVIAHRGASDDRPEQTLAAYEEALRQGAHGLECDVHLSKDGQLVCIHDRRVDRTSDGTGLVRRLTLEEMGAFDFGSWHHSRQLGDAQGHTGLLTLDRLVELVLDHDRPVKLFIEIKHSEKYSWNVEREVVALLQRYGVANPASADQARAAVISFFPDGLKLVRNAAPALPTVFLAPRLDIAPMASVLASHRLAQAIGANGISHYIQTLRAYPELVDLADRQGMIVYPGVVNDQRDALYSLDLGAPWIGTDHPGRTNTWLRGDVADVGAQHPPVRESITLTTGSTIGSSVADTGQNCAVDAAHELSVMYERDIRLAVQPSSRGVPARALFEAVGASAEFATYAEVADRLRQLGDGASAVLASRWSGGRAGGHAYLAINEGGQIVLYDPHTRARSGFPPHWGQDAVAQTAVGYLDSNGDPVDPLRVDVSLRLAAADAVGHVKGVADESDFQRRQDEYRAEDPTTRRVDARYAEPLGDVVDSASSARLSQLAEDLSGTYGPCSVQIEAYPYGGQRVVLDGDILVEGREVGVVAWWFDRDDAGNLVAHHDLHIHDGAFPGREFANAVTSELAPYYMRSGVDRIISATHGKSAYAMAHVGETWDPDPQRLQESVDVIRTSAFALRDQVSGEARLALDRIVQRLEPEHARLPEPIDLATLTTPTEPDLGRRLLEGTRIVRDGTGLQYVKYLWNARWHSAQDCAHWVADALSNRYGIPVPFDVAPSERGVPARALFEAVGSRAEFATYAEIAELLFQMSPGRPGEPGPAAIVVSSWAGGPSRGGHAYLAVVDGGQIYLMDPFTGERLGWPPYWGGDAVSRIAVGYLNADGRPVQPLAGAADELVAADAVGDVQGGPIEPDYSARRQEYRAQDRTTRQVDTRYAEPLGDVVDNASDSDRVRHLANDLSGVYGPYRVQLAPVDLDVDDEIALDGVILSGDRPIGTIEVDFARDREGELFVHLGNLRIDEENFRGKGFAKALTAELERYYIRSGVDRIQLTTEDSGGYAWARRGFTWGADSRSLRASLANIIARAEQLSPLVSDEGRAVIEEIVQRLDPDHPRFPEPIDVAALATAEEPDLGRRLLDGSEWRAVKHLQSPEHVDAVDAVSDVPTHSKDPDFQERQQEYRDQDPVTRPVQTRYADLLGDVVDHPSQDRIDQLGADLSGTYGPYRVHMWRAMVDSSGLVIIGGHILNGDDVIGFVQRAFNRDADGNLVVHHNSVEIWQERFKFKGFSKALASQLDPHYERSDVDHIELRTEQNGGYAWARQGFTWNADRGKLQQSLDSIVDSVRRLLNWVSDDAQVVLRQVVQRLEVGHPRLPEPRELADLATPAEPDLGRQLMHGTKWYGVKHLGDTDRPNTQSRSGFGTSSVSGRDASALSAYNCAHLVADELSEMYGCDFRIDAAPTPTGVPARALFEAIASSARFATYHDVADRLRQLGDGSSAVLASRWAGGRQGGHAYLAVNEGGEIYLVEPHSGQRLGWPPHWGQDAVAQTAVGYLDSDGDPVDRPNVDVPLQLRAAEAIGDVKGHPVDGEPPQSRLAQEALAQRVPPAEASELKHPTGDAQLAVERARANAAWWKGLSEDQRRALIETYPVQIGNAEGIPSLDCHEANARVLQDLLRYRDQLQSRLDGGIRLGLDNSHELLRLNDLENALSMAADFARRAGVDGPHLLRFDPWAFHGMGIAIVSFGVDPYLAESVSWHIPGRGMTIDELGPGMGSALNHLMSTLREDPTASAASMTWIGHDTMADDAARIGGEILYGDLLAFNAGRDALATDGSHFTNNHVFGHCQGSTVAGYAGEGERLDGEIRTVTHFGSPGAGPVNHASEFGPGVDVYAASSSTDSFTWPESRAAFLNGMGVDPAMDFFGAQRITAEFPLTEMTRAGDYDIHNFYYKFVDKSTGQRNESLANFGRIAAGHIERIELEAHRTVVTEPNEASRTQDPAAARSVRLEDPGSSGIEPIDNCAHNVAAVLSATYERDIRIEAASSPTGVAARGLFEAVGSGAEFASYTEVADMLVHLGPGSSAVLASRWTGARYGGHAYLAVNDGGEIYLMDSRTGRRSGWPPHWGEYAVSRTAVGYLDAQGNPVDPLHDVPLQLAAADAVGDVRGIDPSIGGSPDPLTVLGLPDHGAASMSDAEARAAYTDGEQRMRELDQRLIRDGVSVEDRARSLAQLRDSLRAWTRDLMSNRIVADFLAANETSSDFDELVAHNEAKGLVGDSIYEAIIHTATHSHVAPGALSDIDTTALYSEFELQMRDYHAQLIRDGISVEQRARILSELRNSLRAWTRDLMSNRVVADFLAVYEGRPAFADLVARNEAKGLVGDAVYEAIIHTATHSHYAQGTLSEAETRTVYTTFELRMREVNDHLVRAGAGLEERARSLYGMRAALRTWTRALMEDRELAEWLNANEPNPAFEALVERQRTKGREGDAIYEAIIASATRSRPSVNEALGIDPDNPPPLPPMRGATDND